MYSKEFWNKNKRKMFPSITNWKIDQPWSKEEDVSKLTWNQWFYFHPTAFALMHIGQPLLGTMMCLLIGVIVGFKFNWAASILPFLIMGIFIYDFIKKWKQKKRLPSNFSYYDLWMREY